MKFSDDGYAEGFFDDEGDAIKDLVYAKSLKFVMTKRQFNDWLHAGDLYDEADDIVREVMGDEYFEDMEVKARVVDAFLYCIGLYIRTEAGGISITRPVEEDDEWKREIAQQAGMGLGVEAYNDAMGYDVEEPE